MGGGGEGVTKLNGEIKEMNTNNSSKCIMYMTVR